LPLKSRVWTWTNTIFRTSETTLSIFLYLMYMFLPKSVSIYTERKLRVVNFGPRKILLAFIVDVNLKIPIVVINKLEEIDNNEILICITTRRALQNWKIFLKALSKWLLKWTIKMKQLWQLKLLSFVKVHD